MKTISGLLSTATVAVAIALTPALPAQAAQSCDSELTSIRMNFDRAQPGVEKSMAGKELREAETAAAQSDERTCLQAVARAKHHLHRGEPN